MSMPKLKWFEWIALVNYAYIFIVSLFMLICLLISKGYIKF